jgi:hypothetical protein
MPVGVDQISMPVYTHSGELASAPHVAPRHAVHYDPISVLKERRWNHINIRASQRLFWRTLPSVSKSNVQPRHCRRRVVVVGGGAMVDPRGRGSLEHGDWAAKAEVSKKKKGRENIPAVYQQEGEPAHGAEATGMLHDLAKE